MPEKREWERTRKGNIKTTSLHNARIALKDLDITGTYSRDDGEVHVLYLTGRTAQPRREVLRYIRGKIFDRFNFAPTYAAVEDALAAMAGERIGSKSGPK